MLLFKQTQNIYFNQWFLCIWLGNIAFKVDRIFLAAETRELKDLGKFDLRYIVYVKHYIDH